MGDPNFGTTYIVELGGVENANGVVLPIVEAYPHFRTGKVVSSPQIQFIFLVPKL